MKQLLDTGNDGCTINTLKEAELVFYKRRIYFTKQLQQHTMEWYHHNLNQPGGDWLYKTQNKVCYLKYISNQISQYCKRHNMCQQHKPRRIKFGHVPPKNTGELKPWHTLHAHLIGIVYSITTKLFQPNGGIIAKEL